MSIPDHGDTLAASNSDDVDIHLTQGEPVKSVQFSDHVASDLEQSHIMAAKALGNDINSDTDDSMTNMDLEHANGSRVVTVTGTITRGYKAGEKVDIKLRLTDDELQKLNTSNDDLSDHGPTACIWGPRRGLHIALFTVLFIPFAFISSLCVSFYYGAQTWYNLFLYYSEEQTIWHKIFLCPILILSFPFTVGLSALGIASYAAVIQVSWFLSSWLHEIQDFEKGFYGWFCNKIGLTDCAPYEVVVLDESLNPGNPQSNDSVVRKLDL